MISAVKKSSPSDTTALIILSAAEQEASFWMQLRDMEANAPARLAGLDPRAGASACPIDSAPIATDDCPAVSSIRPGEQIMAYKFEVYKDKAGEFRFRFKAPNGESMFSSEGYAQKASAVSAIESIKKNAPGAATDDQTK